MPVQGIAPQHSLQGKLVPEVLDLGTVAVRTGFGEYFENFVEPVEQVEQVPEQVSYQTQRPNH